MRPWAVVVNQTCSEHPRNRPGPIPTSDDPGALDPNRTAGRLRAEVDPASWRAGRDVRSTDRPHVAAAT
jgi:hypothetical protein